MDVRSGTLLCKPHEQPDFLTELEVAADDVLVRNKIGVRAISERERLMSGSVSAAMNQERHGAGAKISDFFRGHFEQIPPLSVIHHQSPQVHTISQQLSFILPKRGSTTHCDC